MVKSISIAFLLSICILIYANYALAQERYTLSTMPRVDVHTHFDKIRQTDGIINISNILKERYNINLDVFINLGPYINPRELSLDFLKEVEEKYNSRILPCISDYDITNGLKYSPAELAKWQKYGIVGYKIWAPVVTGINPPAKDIFTIWDPGGPGINHPANDPTFTKMAQIGLIGASIHIGQAHPRRWKDPVHFWTSINSWEKVLDKHPDMVVVMAHMFNLFYSDEQLEYLQYILETYPNVNLDIGGRFVDFSSMKSENIRNFMIKYADRILFGTDFGNNIKNGNHLEIAERYFQYFQILETDKVINGGFFKTNKVQGIALPLDVLEKIYFRNAIRLYPRVKDVLESLGYNLD